MIPHVSFIFHSVSSLMFTVKLISDRGCKNRELFCKTESHQL
nr:Hypothetical protein [Aeromonas sp.]